MAIEDSVGRWKVTIDVGRDPITNKRRRVTRILPKGATKKEARDLEATLRVDARGAAPATKSLTVGELLDAWLEHVRADLSPTTVQGYRKNIERYLRPAFGTLPVRKLTAARIDALYRAMRKRGVRGNELSPASVRRVHATLTSACAQAVKWEWLPSNPCDRATVGRGERREIEPPSLEQIIAVVEKADDDLRDAIGLALATGARRGELCGLRWEDVDLANGAVTFRRAVGHVDGQVIIIPDSRRKSMIRTLAIDAPTVDALKGRRARHAELALGLPGTFRLGRGYVLADMPVEPPEPLDPQLLSHRWRMAAKRAGVSARLHDLRHWHVSELLRERIPTPNVVKRAGWASPQMLRVYAHAAEEVDRDAADAIGRRRAR